MLEREKNYQNSKRCNNFFLNPLLSLEDPPILKFAGITLSYSFYPQSQASRYHQPTEELVQIAPAQRISTWEMFPLNPRIFKPYRLMQKINSWKISQNFIELMRCYNFCKIQFTPLSLLFFRRQDSFGESLGNFPC